MPHPWESCLDLTTLPADKRSQVTQALNWLEKYFPEFNEMIWEIGRGQKAGKLKGIHLRAANPARGENTKTIAQEGIIRIDFTSLYYLGLDNKVYDISLNELLVHELVHIQQSIQPGFDLGSEKLLAVRLANLDSDEALRQYVLSKSHNNTEDYLSYLYNGDDASKKKLDQKILADPKYRKLEHACLATAEADDKLTFPDENEAMDQANILSQILGKSPREHYSDVPILEQKRPFKGSLLIYTDPPEIIRQKAYKTWPISSMTPLPPFVTYRAREHTGNIAQMQRDWNNKWNADTKNITSEEWRVIEETKGKLLSVEVLKTITPENKKTVDHLIDEMKKNFNQTPETDALSDTTQQSLAKKGLSALAEKNR